MRPFANSNLFHGFAGHGPLYDVHARLSINGIDLESVLGQAPTAVNPLVGATWTAHADQLATTGEIRLNLGLGVKTRSPLFSISQLRFAGAAPRAGSTFALQTATVAKSQPPSGWATVWDGEIDDANMVNGEVVLTCRDLMGRALDRIIEPDTATDKEGFYRTAELMHARLLGIQSTVAAYAPDVNDLSVQMLQDPGWTVIASWTDSGQSLAEAWHAVVLQRGWAIHYRYIEGGDVGRVAVYDPLIGAGSPEYQLGQDEIIRFGRFSHGRDQVRNVVAMRYGTARTYLSASDAASITAYGRRYMQIGEEFTQEIDTVTEAQRMLDGAIRDQKDPQWLVDLDRFYQWNVELGDTMNLPIVTDPRFNGVETDIPLTLAVVGYTHSLDFRAGGQMRSTIRTIGSPVAARRRWKKTKPKPVLVSTLPPAGGAKSGTLHITVADLTP